MGELIKYHGTEHTRLVWDRKGWNIRPLGIHNAPTSSTVTSLPDTELPIKLACTCVMVYCRQQPAITISIKLSTPYPRNIPLPLTNPHSHTVRYNLNPISTLGLNFSCGSYASYLTLVANTITDTSN